MPTAKSGTNRACHHCGKSSPSLLRCSQCKSAYYCNRTCQSAAWDPVQSRQDRNGTAPSGGHRSVCRRLRKRVEQITASSSRRVDESAVAKEAWRDLTRHVQSIDRDQAYKQMCMVQDEILRLQQIQSDGETTEMEARAEALSAITKTSRDYSLDAVDAQEGRMNDVTNTKPSDEVSGASDPHCTTIRSQDQSKKSKTCEETHLLTGQWIDKGGTCSIEYLPNVRCYLLTLTSAGKNEQFCCIPKSRENLILDFSLVENNHTDLLSSPVSYYTANLYHTAPTENNDNCDNLLLSLVLPADRTTVGIHQTLPDYNISIDTNSISVRIQFNDSASKQKTSIENTNVMNELLGVDESTLSSSTATETEDLNRLCCRTCHNPIVTNGVIRSVLPLPSGYWDDITDYLVCYDGVSLYQHVIFVDLFQASKYVLQQPNVEFNSSSTSAIRGVALEDDAVLILHRQDLLTEKGGICKLNVKGYGEYSSYNKDYSEISCSETNSQPWKDKSLKSGAEVQTVTCVTCCSTLGFVSNHDKNTYRFYKHLLSCGSPSDLPRSYHRFDKHTCGSFLAREMIRCAEREAIYTFIVESDTDSPSSPCILLRMLSWDTIMATVGCSDNKENKAHQTQFQKVLKVIFEETTNQNFDLATNNPMDWKWGIIDMCCPPPANKNNRSNKQANNSTVISMKISNINAQKKTTSIRICLSPREWCELKDSLVTRSQYFSEAIRRAVVLAKLGTQSEEKINGISAFLSFLHVAA
ncbi:hypothetical protein ACHAW6_012407 [Cyclotella cf. meneghiniana]